MTTWREVDAPGRSVPRASGARVASRVGPPVAAAALLWLLDAHRLALVVAVVGSGLGLAALRWPPVARGVDRVVHGLGHLVGRILTWTLLGLFMIVVVVPVSLVTRVLHRDVLLPSAGSTVGGWWRRRHAEEPDLAPHTFGFEPVPVRGRVGRVMVRLPRMAGWLVIALALDLAVGAAVRGDASTIELTEQLERATAGDAWFDGYRRELASVRYGTDAFVLSLPVDHEGSYINVEDGRRRTTQSPALVEGAPVVWIFGGSPAWGEGQRDAHTIASELAALAGDAGTPVEVVNWAVRGDSAFVAAQRFERALAHEPAPDLAIFLDGPDDVAIQAEHVTGEPSQYGLELAEQVVRHDDRTLLARYEDTSALFALGQRLREVIAMAPAGAATIGGEDPTDAPEVTSTTVDAIATAAASVYRRGRDLADLVARQHGVPARHFWLPVAASSDPGSLYRRTVSHLDGGVTVLDPLDTARAPVFLDAVHTNEDGARQVATLVYATLAAALAVAG